MEKWWEVPADEWSDALVAAMKLGGVDNLFFVSGSELTFYQEAIAKAEATGRAAPRLVTMTHENVALNAALGNSMVRNAPAATAVHVDVATMHAGAAVHSAWRGGYPVLMTAGTGPRAFPGSMRAGRSAPVHWVQEPRDQGEIVRQYTKADHRLEHLDNPGLMVSRLLQLAMSPPRGPVYLSIPQETAMLALPGVARFPVRDQLGVATDPWPSPDDLRDIARQLVRADEPVLYTSSSGRDKAAFDDLLRLVELLALPVMESDHADRLNVSATHWSWGTGSSAHLVDVALVVEDMVPYIPGTAEECENAAVIWVGPDPVHSRQKTLEFRTDRWITASAGPFFRGLFEAATAILTKADQRRIGERRRRLEDRRRALDNELVARLDDDRAGPILTGRLVAEALGAIAGEDAIILNDALSNGGLVRRYARRTQSGTYFRSGSSSGGWGAGAAFGAKLAAPDRDVILATGDGYFTFGTPLAALWAAEHHNAPFLTVVFVNGSYSTGTRGLERSYPEGYAVAAGHLGGTFEPPPDFAKLAEAANCYGENVTEKEELLPALRRGLSCVREGTPAVIAAAVSRS